MWSPGQAFGAAGTSKSADNVVSVQIQTKIPALLAIRRLLQMLEVQISQFPPSQSAAKQDRENCAVPFAFEVVGVRSLRKPARLLCREPVSKPHAEFLDILHATDAGRELRAEQTGICRLVR
jgi:hypothetical protein